MSAEAVRGFPAAAGTSANDNGSAAKGTVMREYGVRRYGDVVYRHCMAESAEAAAQWFAHVEPGIADKNFQALVLDVALPLSEAPGAANPQVVHVRHAPKGESSAVDLKRTSALRTKP
jgi:hypothetical protein